MLSIIDPVQRFCFTSCDSTRIFPSLISPPFAGDLSSPYPDPFHCNAANGLRLTHGALVNEAIEADATNPFGSDDPPFLETAHFLGDMQEYFKNSNPSGLTVAAWVTPAASHKGEMQPILTIGTRERPSIEDLYTPGCPGYDFQILQFEKAFQISYTDGNEGLPCRSIRVPHNLLDAGSTHIAVTLDGMYTHVYINGEVKVLGIRNLFDATLEHWNLSESSLQLFSAYAAAEKFRGSIQQVDVFDQFMDASEIEDIYNEGAIVMPTNAPTSMPSISPSVAPSLDLSETPSMAPTMELILLVEANTVDNKIRQGATDSLSIGLDVSHNMSPSQVRLEMEFTSLPRYGSLSVGSDVPTVGLGFPLAQDSTSITVDYALTDADYFNEPRINAFGDDLDLESETFEFKLWALNSANEVIAVTDTVTQMVKVIHVNHPSILTVPDEAQLSNVDASMAMVSGIALEDAFDFCLNRVRVDVWSSHGTLSLAGNYATLADFDSCRDRHTRLQLPASWYCTGTGNDDTTMTFVAMPENVGLILRHLKYRNLQPGTDDEITVRVSDGAGGMCLDESEHKALLQHEFTSIRDQCFQRTGTVHVPGTAPKNPGKTPTGENGGGGSNGFASLADLLFWGLLILVIAACALCGRRLTRCLARGKAVEATDNNNNNCGEGCPV